MKVKQIMTAPPQTCPGGMHLADASRRMRDTGYGSLVVLGPGGRVAGMLTDRDLALALASIRDAAQLTVDHVMSRPVLSCRPDDDLNDALERMARGHVRRLPVLEGRDIKGLLSIDDIVLWGLESSGVSMRRLISAWRAIRSAHRPIADDVPV